MVPKQNIELQKEYSVSKITGRWGIRRRIRKLGINSETKLSFTKKSKLAYYKFHFTNCKRKDDFLRII